MTKVLRPALVIPLTLGAAVLAALVAFSDPAQVVAVMEGFRIRDLLSILALMVAYEALRCAQWCVLLRAMGIRAPLRIQVFSFLGGELTAFLPAGTYFRNYLLGRSSGAEFGRSSAATTVSLVSEIVICLAGVVIIGLEGWSSWLRPLIVVGAAVFLVLVWAVHGSGFSVAAPRWLRGRAVFQRALNEIRQFRAGAVALLQPRVLVVQSLLGTLYLTVAGTVLYVVLRSLGMGQVTLWQALSDRLRQGLVRAIREAGFHCLDQGVGPFFQIFFGDTDKDRLYNYRDTMAYVRDDIYSAWHEEMQKRGVYFHPGQFERWFLSTAHTERDIDITIDATAESMREVAKRIPPTMSPGHHFGTTLADSGEMPE